MRVLYFTTGNKSRSETQRKYAHEKRAAVAGTPALELSGGLLPLIENKRDGHMVSLGSAEVLYIVAL